MRLNRKSSARLEWARSSDQVQLQSLSFLLHDSSVNIIHVSGRLSFISAHFILNSYRKFKCAAIVQWPRKMTRLKIEIAKLTRKFIYAALVVDGEIFFTHFIITHLWHCAQFKFSRKKSEMKFCVCACVLFRALIKRKWGAKPHGCVAPTKIQWTARVVFIYMRESIFIAMSRWKLSLLWLAINT